MHRPAIVQRSALAHHRRGFPACTRPRGSRRGDLSAQPGPRPATVGFSLIELLIVVAIIAALTGTAMIRMDLLTDDARLATLRHNLRVMRQAIDDYHADRHAYPAGLSDLVDRRYLREIPVDPMIDAADRWVTVASYGHHGDVADVHSSMPGYGGL